MSTCVAVRGRARSSVTSLNFGAPGVWSSVRRKARLVVGMGVDMLMLFYRILVSDRDAKEQVFEGAGWRHHICLTLLADEHRALEINAHII